MAGIHVRACSLSHMMMKGCNIHGGSIGRNSRAIHIDTTEAVPPCDSGGGCWCSSSTIVEDLFPVMGEDGVVAALHSYLLLVRASL